MITEILMEPGGFRVELTDDCPNSVLDDLSFFGGIVVTPAHVNDPDGFSNSQLLSMSMYTGILTGLSNTRRTLEGYGPAYLLGTSGGLSDTYEADQTPGSLTLEQWVKAKVLTGGSDDLNGITCGTIEVESAKVGEIEKGSTPLDVLNWLVTDMFDGDWLAGNLWRITPSLVLDVAHYTTLFRNVSTLLSPLTGGTEARWPGDEAAGFRCRFDVEQDVEDWTSRVVVEDTSAGTGSADNASSYLPITSGSAIERTRLYTSNKTTTGNAASAAAGILAQYDAPRRQITAEVFETYAVRKGIEPGDMVLYYDPDQGITGEVDMYWRGLYLQADYAFVVGLDWPLQRGMGVYHLPPGSSTTVDITDYVVWDNQNPTVHLGAMPRKLTVVEQPGRH